jgi:DNA-binding NarL/FixJ family response regulator
MKGMYGSSILSPKEVRITRLAAAGYKNKEIAPRVATTELVIKNYLRTIFDKTGMSTRLELALWWLSRQNLCEGCTLICPKVADYQI